MQKKYQILLLVIFGILAFHGAGAQEIASSGAEVPWAWYISRASGLMAFALLYVSIFLGLTLRIPLLRKIFAPAIALDVHAWISVQATVFAFLHGAALLFDKFLNLSLADLFVPFVSDYEPGLLALGIFSFYLMIILVATSYGKKYISHKLWRAVHFLNILLYAFVLIHAVKLGTDLKNPIAYSIFLWSNVFLIFLMLINMQLRIADTIRIRKARLSK